MVLPRIHPMRLRLVREPFDHPDYIFELKHDGFVAVVYLQARECKIISRNQRNLGFESLKKALVKLPVQNAILDGEIVCLDGKGVSQFNQLLSRKGEPVFYAFDLLWLDGEDLRQMPLSSERSDSHDSSGPRSVQGCFMRSTSSSTERPFSRKFASVSLRGLWRSGSLAFTRTTATPG